MSDLITKQSLEADFDSLFPEEMIKEIAGTYAPQESTALILELQTRVFRLQLEDAEGEEA